MNAQPDFPSVPIGEVSQVNPRGPAKAELSPDDEVDFLPMADLHEDGSVHVAERRRYEEVAKGYTAFKKGDVLLAKITPCFENNKIGLAEVSTDWAFGSTEFHVLRTSEKLDRRYLTHFLRQDFIRGEGEKRMTGSAGQRRVPKTFLEELKIPLPPLEEQKRIAGILDQADALRRIRTRALDKLNTLGHAIFHEMFGGFPNGEILRDCPELGEFLLDVKNGLTRRAKGSEEQNDIVLRLKDIRELEVDFSAVARISLDAKEKQKFSIEKGDLLFVRVNGNADYVGRNAVFHQFDEPVYFNDHIMRVRVTEERLIPHFLSFLLNSRFGKAQIAQNRKTSAGQHTINQDGLSKIRLPVPSLEQQREFVDALERIDSWRGRANASLSVSSDLFASLQNRAFRGEL